MTKKNYKKKKKKKKRFVEDINVFLKNKKKKSDSTVRNYVKISKEDEKQRLVEKKHLTIFRIVCSIKHICNSFVFV